MKFLGELYNYKILDASTIFEALYTTITFGHGISTCCINIYY